MKATRKERLDKLAIALHACQSPTETKRALKLLFSDNELKWAADRWFAMEVLTQPNVTQRDAVTITGLSIGKITRAVKANRTAAFRMLRARITTNKTLDDG